MLPQCEKCNGLSFELKEFSPVGGRFKMYFVQCSSCKNKVGVTDYFHTNSIVEKESNEIKNSISNLERKVDQLSYNLQQIINHLNSRR
jgi:hypothetical protein